MGASLRRLFVVALAVCVFAVSFPSTPVAGGCDDPGFLPNCKTKNSAPGSPGAISPVSPPAVRVRTPGTSSVLARSLARNWLMFVLNRVVF